MNVQDLVAKYKTNTPAATTPSTGGTSAPKTVQDLVAKYKNYQAPPAPTPDNQSFASKMFGAAKNFSTGVAKSEVSAVNDLGTLVSKGASAIPGPVGKAFAGGANFGQQVSQSPQLQPKGTAEEAGNIVGTIAPYFTGAGEEEGAAKLASLIPKIADHLGVDAGSFGTKVATYLAKKAPSAVAQTAVGTAQTGNLKQGAEQGLAAESIGVAGDALKGAKNLAGDAVGAVRTKIAQGKVPLMKGLDEQVKTSAGRLKPIVEAAEDKATQLGTAAERVRAKVPMTGMGAAIRKPLVKVYDDFADQEAKHLADIKEDPAISMVGSEIGDAFKDVVKQRQAAGKTMSAELEKGGKALVDTKGAFSNFQKELIDNGAKFYSVAKELTAGSESKFGSADKSVLEKYASDLQDLGNKPTMKQLDAFLGRMPNEIKGLKAAKGITFKTNAERLISNNMNDLRDALGKSGSPEYNAARKTYANLSDFIKEGSGFLGKITQSGDFAKDASLAKSSVQSVLNNGKKDWLVQLEKHTGYPALDRSVLALQAMKDAGDAKGNSLLELLSQGAEGAAAGPHGLLAGMVHGITGMGKKVIAGSAADQTRAYLKALKL